MFKKNASALKGLFNFNLYLIPTVIQAVFGMLVMVPITTYYLDPEDFGVVAILTALVAPIGPLASSGCSWVLGGNYFNLKDKERRELLFNLVLVDFILKSIWVFLFWVGSFFLLRYLITDYRPEYNHYFFLSLLGVWLAMFTPTVRQLLVLKGSAKVHFTLEIARWFISVATTIICLSWLKLGLITLFIAPVSANLLSLLLEVWIIAINSHFVLKRNWLIEVVKVGLPSIPSNLSENLSRIADRYFIQNWLSLTQLGLYSHAQRYSQPMQMLMKALGRTISPIALRAFSHGDQAASDKLSSIIKGMIWGLVSVGILLSIYALDVVDLLTHGKFNDAAPLIPLWFLLSLSQVYGTLFTFYLNAKKEVFFLMKSMMTMSLVFVFIIGLNTYLFGAYGAVLSVVGANFSIQIWRRIKASKLGCTVHYDRDFMVGMTVFAICFLIVNNFTFSFYIKGLFSILVVATTVFKIKNLVVSSLGS